MPDRVPVLVIGRLAIDQSIQGQRDRSSPAARRHSAHIADCRESSPLRRGSGSPPAVSAASAAVAGCVFVANPESVVGAFALAAAV